MTAPYRTPVTGERLADRYELGRHIDSGGMAEVWEATDHTLGRLVAVKILHAHLARDAGFLSRFRREAINAAGLQHPAIVAIYDAVSSDGLEAIVMERIEGRTLRSVLDEHGRLPARDVVDMGRQIAQALAVAHAAGVIHRDIKPSNIMLCEDRRVRITDFGIAKAGEDTDLTRTGTLLGTAKYLSPEQVVGDQVDARSDLYGLGVVLFESLAGQPPFDEGNDYATAQARLVSRAPALCQYRPDLPDSLDRLVGSLLEQDPTRRPGSAEELAVMLTAIRIDSEELAPAPNLLERTTIDLRPNDDDDTAETRTRTDLARPSPISAPPEDDPLADPPDAGPPARRRFSIGPIIIIVLVVASVGIAAALLARLRSDPDTASPSEPIELTDGDSVSLTPLQQYGPPSIASVQAVDPLGDETENDEIANLAIDGDPATAWKTETYRNPGFSGVKSGVGFLVTLEEPSVVTAVRITSPTEGWSARVFVGDTVPDPIDGAWDAGPYDMEAMSGDGSVELESITGTRVLLWLTFEGTSPNEDVEGGEPQNRFELAEITIE